MPDLKGSKTYDNLAFAFAGESQATNKYLYYASQAKKDGYEQIAAYFTETSGNESEHAKLWYKYLRGGKVDNTTVNLRLAADGEHEEWTSMYKEFAEVARAEGFTEIAEKFEGVAAIERVHEARYLALLENIEKNAVFSRNNVSTWVCRNCGHIHMGTASPLVCPVCEHPQAYFELKATNY